MQNFTVIIFDSMKKVKNGFADSITNEILINHLNEYSDAIELLNDSS